MMIWRLVFVASSISALLVAWWGSDPPAVVEHAAPAGVFSAARAQPHLDATASRPHPIGTEEHARVRAYLAEALVGLGIETEVQEAWVEAPESHRPGMVAGVARNVVARIPGTSSTGAVMLACHYDSVPTSPAAADDGAAVAALLEVARALRAGQPLRNDVILLFTDAEESGLLGARAFLGHRWAKHVRVVLNFEARGRSGPSQMFQVVGASTPLIGALAQVPRPAAMSLAPSVYALLPHLTDLDTLTSTGAAGLNFAFSADAAYYHTEHDTSANLDLRSLQHHGEHALSLAQTLGNHDLTPLAAKEHHREQIFFDLAGVILVRYGAGWAIPLAALAALGFGSLVWLGRRRRALSVKALLGGVVALPLAAVLATAWAVGLTTLLAPRWGTTALRLADVWTASLVQVAVTAGAIAIWLLMAGRMSGYRGALAVSLGTAMWWAVAALASAVLLPGASYLFTWPLLAMLVVAWADLAVADDRRDAPRPLVARSCAAIVLVLLWLPAVRALADALTVRLAAAVAVLVVLAASGLGVALLGPVGPRHHARLGLAVALAAIALGVWAGLAHPGPMPNHVAYALDADRGEARWLSRDARPDAWTQQFLGAEPEQVSKSMFFPAATGPVLSAPAPAVTLPPPEIERLDESRSAGQRIVRVRVASRRRAPVLRIGITGADFEVVALREAVPAPAGRHEPGRAWLLTIHAPPDEGVVLTISLREGAEVTLQAVDQSYELPASGARAARPADAMENPWLPDSTLVGRSLVL